MELLSNILGKDVKLFGGFSKNLRMITKKDGELKESVEL